MEISNSLLTQNVSPPEKLPDINGINGASDEKKKQFAMEFESLLINKLMEEMTNSISSFGDEEDSAREQVKGIFNMFLSQHVGLSGGIGLSKDIYESLKEIGQEDVQPAPEFDKQI